MLGGFFATITPFLLSDFRWLYYGADGNPTPYWLVSVKTD